MSNLTDAYWLVAVFNSATGAGVKTHSPSVEIYNFADAKRFDAVSWDRLVSGGAGLSSALRPRSPRLRRSSCSRDPATVRIEHVNIRGRRGQLHHFAGWRGSPATDFGNRHLVVGAPHVRIRGFTQPFDELDDSSGDEVAVGGGRQVLGADADGDGCAGLERPGGENEWGDQSPAIRALPSSTLSTLAGKKFIAGEPMKPATNRSAGE